MVGCIGYIALRFVDWAISHSWCKKKCDFVWYYYILTTLDNLHIEPLMSSRWNCISMKAMYVLDRFCPRSTSSKFEGMWEESFNTRVVANQSSRARRFCCFQCWHSKFEIFFKNTRMNHLLGAIHPKINCWITIFVSVRNNSLSINWCILYCIPGLETLHFFYLKVVCLLCLGLLVFPLVTLWDW